MGALDTIFKLSRLMWEIPCASSCLFIRLGGHKQILENIYISVTLKKREVGNYDSTELQSAESVYCTSLGAHFLIGSILRK